jgi:hypothetical protein
MLHICHAYSMAHCYVVGKSLWLRGQMLVLMLWNQWNRKLKQVVVDAYCLWMFCKCLILMWWWYWKLLDMGIISMTFLRNPSNVMSCRFTCFLMNLLKLIKTFLGGCMVTCLFVSIWHLWWIYFLCNWCFH